MDEAYVVSEYTQNNKSIYAIAEVCGTYPNKIRRILVKHGVQLRTKSEAQSTAIKAGRHSHPTKGKQRTRATREKISEAVHQYWNNLSDAAKQDKSDVSKKQWQAMSEGERETLRRMAAEAVRRAAQEGSKLEKYLLVELRLRGYTVEFHRENVVVKEKLQIDLFLPNEGIAIEIDGPTHFLPIWGEVNLTKHLAADQTKTGLLIQAGYKVLRIKNLTKHLSEFNKRKVLTATLNVLESLDEHDSLIELEVK
jgi:very-short-patch-repair endonuclease